MKRRDFLKDISIASLAMSVPAFTSALQARTARASNHLISGQGCGRATGYAEANKIVTVGSKTHFSWLDSEEESFVVKIRTYDHQLDEWSPVYTVGNGYDNHGGPAITVDKEGYLHIVFYPHHHAMSYRKSSRPNDASRWEEVQTFGERLTYPTIVCGADNTLYLTARRSYTDRPWHAELWTKAPGASWEFQRKLMQARFEGYSHYQESLAWGPDHQTLHLATRIHEKTDQDSSGRIQTVAYMVSSDSGISWKNAQGKDLSRPFTADQMDILEEGGLDVDKVLRAGALGVDAENKPIIPYSIHANNKGWAILARPDEQGRWEKLNLNQFLPKPYRDWNMSMPGGVSVNQQREIFVSAQIHQAYEEQSWGHPSNEVILFKAKAWGKKFKAELISKPNPETPNWLPNIEKPTGFNLIRNRPAIIYTGGKAGEGLKDMLSNQVFANQG